MKWYNSNIKSPLSEKEGDYFAVKFFADSFIDLAIIRKNKDISFLNNSSKPEDLSLYYIKGDFASVLLSDANDVEWRYISKNEMMAYL